MRPYVAEKVYNKMQSFKWAPCETKQDLRFIETKSNKVASLNKNCFKGYFCYKTILCHKAALDVQLMIFLREEKMFRSRYIEIVLFL